MLYSPLQGRSVPFWRSTWYWAGVSRSRHSSSVVGRSAATSERSALMRSSHLARATAASAARRPVHQHATRDDEVYHDECCRKLTEIAGPIGPGYARYVLSRSA